MAKNYDRDYFDRWYRSSDSRVRSRADLRRRVHLAVAITEHLMRRPVRTVLDIGCGEGEWFVELQKIRPAIRYEGLDSSEYAVERFGRRRNIRLATFGQLPEIEFRHPFDLVVCSDVLHYVADSEVDRGLGRLSELVEACAYLSVFTTEDDPSGDLHGWKKRPASWYRSRFTDAGLIPCGMQLYATADVIDAASEMEVSGSSISTDR
jgi:SAM-dependent methyltransferase